MQVKPRCLSDFRWTTEPRAQYYEGIKNVSLHFQGSVEKENHKQKLEQHTLINVRYNSVLWAKYAMEDQRTSGCGIHFCVPLCK